MKLHRLKKLVDSYYNFDVSQKSRINKVVNAKKVYCKLARDFGNTLQDIGDSIGYGHSTVLHHLNSYHLVEDNDRKIYRRCMEVYVSLPNIDVEDIKREDGSIIPDSVMRAKYRNDIQELNEKINELKSKLEDSDKFKRILSHFDGWTEIDKEDFIETRLIPYSISRKYAKRRMKRLNTEVE